jgi:hypothetical protein
MAMMKHTIGLRTAKCKGAQLAQMIARQRPHRAAVGALCGAIALMHQELVESALVGAAPPMHYLYVCCCWP